MPEHKLKKYLGVLLFSAGCFLNNVSVYASSTTANAVNDILFDDRYEGAIDSIKEVTLITDAGFQMFITFVAFFIISAAMLRNVLAGAYWSYPKFWDKVYEAHAEVQDQGWFTRITGFAQGGWREVNVGSLGKSLMRLCPNIKVLTDFETETVEPKQYFIKAIPEMLIVVIIGVFIYNGYYRDTAAVVSNFGAEMFTRVFTSCEPVAFFDRLTGSVGTPDFESDTDKTPTGQLINKISKKAYSKVVATYSDIKGAANKAKLAADLEAWVTQELNSKASAQMEDNLDHWNYSYKVSLVIGSAKESKVKESKDGLTVPVVFSRLPISSLNLDTTKEEGVDWTVSCQVLFTKKSAKSSSMAHGNLTLNFKSKDTNTLPAGSKVSLNGTTHYITLNNGDKVNFTLKNNKLSFDKNVSAGTYKVSGLQYDGDKVVQIVLGASSNGVSSSSIEGIQSGFDESLKRKNTTENDSDKSTGNNKN